MNWISVFVLLLLWTALGQGQTECSLPGPSAALLALLEVPGNQGDPGYSLYKEGYNFILEEKWEAAHRKFADLITRHRTSEYLDDAHYWSAYALKHFDRAKARDAYRLFIRDFPRSSYYDDALADLGALDQFVVVHTAPEGKVRIKTSGDTRAYSYAFGTSQRQLERALRMQSRHLDRLRIGRAALAFRTHEKLDPGTRVKMEALYALGESREDEQAFQTLREVALNRKQPVRLREAALDALSQFRTFDVLPVFVDVARTDTSRRIQVLAVDCIADAGKDKNASVDVLIGLFTAIPKDRTEQAESIFYVIAEVGNDRAIDFLTKVATTHENYDLRSDAVYYLGNIGGEKARKALYQILKSN